MNVIYAERFTNSFVNCAKPVLIAVTARNRRKTCRIYAPTVGKTPASVICRITSALSAGRRHGFASVTADSGSAANAVLSVTLSVFPVITVCSAAPVSHPGFRTGDASPVRNIHVYVTIPFRGMMNLKRRMSRVRCRLLSGCQMKCFCSQAFPTE